MIISADLHLRWSLRGFQVVNIAIESYDLSEYYRLCDLSRHIRRDKIYAWTNHTDDGIYSDHGYLDTLDNPLGPP